MCIDLHIHTGASPCGAKEMSPWSIVRMAQLEGLSLIAITDHNTAANVGAVMQVGDQLGLPVLPGMEVQTREEVHLLGIFPSLEAVLAFEQLIWQHLPKVANQPQIFGEQIVYDSADRQKGSIERLLLQSVTLGVEEVGKAITAHGGVTIAAHVNRRSYGLLGQLGFVPETLKLDAVEIDRYFSYERFMDEHQSLGRYPVLRNSDAHQLIDLVDSHSSVVLIEEPSFLALRELLLSGDVGRIRLR